MAARGARALRLALVLLALVVFALEAAPAGAATPARAGFTDGVLTLDGKRRFMVSGDYPYYRDDASTWGHKLDLLKAAGVEIVTFYVPWRHHQPAQGRAPDFTGATQANRNVVGFIQLIRERGMLAIVKPGPFVHAELNEGGLPDWVNPSRNLAIRPDSDALGLPTTWVITQTLMPDFFDPEFRRLTDEWMRAVATQVIRPFEAPAGGPVIGVQVINERIYSDSGAIASPGAAVAYGVSSSGYSAPRIADWGRGEPPRSWVQPTSLAGAERYVSWGLHQGEDYRDAANAVIDALSPLRVPVVLNPAPDVDPVGLPAPLGPSNGEDWLVRTEADAAGARYAIGYTNWVGVVMKQPKAYQLYVMVATRFPGPNLEENWGFGEIYDPQYKRAQPSVFQSVAFTAWGSTGLNFYTGVSTEAFANDPALDNYRTRPYLGFGGIKTSGHTPYPDSAPITPAGAEGHTYPAMRQLARLWARVGDSLVRARPPRNLAWGIYPPYAAAGAWQPLDENWRALGLVGAPHASYKGSEGVIASAIATDTQVGQEHLPTASAADLARWRTLVLAGSRWMDAATQRKLVDYVNGGGTLLLTGDLPVLGADLASGERTLADALLPGVQLAVRDVGDPVRIDAFGGEWRAAGAVSTLSARGDATVEARLPDGTPVAVSRASGRGRIVFVGWQPWESPYNDADQFAGSKGLAEAVAKRFGGAVAEPADPSEEVEVNTFSDGPREHIFVLNRTGEARTVKAGRAEVRVAGHGVAQLMLDDGRLDAAYVDGANDLDPERSTAPHVAVGGCTVSATGPADLLILGNETNLAYAADGARAKDGRDRSAPRSRLTAVSVTRRGVSLRGRVRDSGCAGAPRGDVSVALRTKRGRCRFLTARGRLTRPRACNAPVLLRRNAPAALRVTRRATLPAGRYVVSLRGVDAAGNRERRSAHNTRAVRVR